MQKTVKTYLNLILHIHSFSKSLPQQKPVIASALLRWAQGWNLVGKKQLKTSEKMDMMWFKRAKSVIQSKSSCISTRHLQHHSGSSLRNGEKNISTYSHIHWNTTINLIESKIRLRNSPKLTTLMMFLFSSLTRAPQPIPLVVVASVHGSARGPPSDPKSVGFFLFSWIQNSRDIERRKCHQIYNSKKTERYT